MLGSGGPRRSTPHHKSAVSLRSSRHRMPIRLEAISFTYRSPELCEICRSKSAVVRCGVCGRWVCDEHYEDRYGCCKLCLAALCNICMKNLAIGRCYICGRLVCHRCSIDIDGVRRICFVCIIGSFSSRSRLIS